MPAAFIPALGFAASMAASLLMRPKTPKAPSPATTPAAPVAAPIPKAPELPKPEPIVKPEDVMASQQAQTARRKRTNANAFDPMAAIDDGSTVQYKSLLGQ